MIASVIRWSVSNRFLVLLATLFLAGAGLWAVRSTPIDALPDLSDVQVIIRTSYPGQAPQIVENQVTTRWPPPCCRCREPRRCAPFPSLGTRSSMSCSRMEPIFTGHARVYWST